MFPNTHFPSSLSRTIQNTRRNLQTQPTTTPGTRSLFAEDAFIHQSPKFAGGSNSTKPEEAEFTAPPEASSWQRLHGRLASSKLPNKGGKLQKRLPIDAQGFKELHQELGKGSKAQKEYRQEIQRHFSDPAEFRKTETDVSGTDNPVIQHIAQRKRVNTFGSPSGPSVPKKQDFTDALLEQIEQDSQE